MKRLAVVVSLLAGVCVAGAQSLRSQIDASNKLTDKLMMAKDVKKLGEHWKAGMTPDFKYVEAGKTSDFATMRTGMEMGLGSMKKLTKVSSKLVTLNEKGTTATATTQHVMEGTTLGADKKPHTLFFGGVSEDTYVKQGGKWKMAKMAWISQTMKMDGKAMPTR